MADFGLGALPSPPDDRDYPIDQLYAATGTEMPMAVPATYVVPGNIPPVLNQGSTPRCVAYSSEMMKSYQDRIDQGKFFPFDEAKFFYRIGGGPNGAITRNAFAEMLHAGYPLDSVDQAGQHKIAAYYRVPVTRSDIQAAIMSFGPVVLGMSWYNSWFNPTSTGLLRPPSGGVVGGHAIAAIGWDSRGLRLRNSWGVNWGVNGDCYMPWSYLAYTGEAWKAVDVIEKPSPVPTVTYKYGGYAGYRGRWRVMFDQSRIRSKPYTTASIVATVPHGYVFVAYQTTVQGSTTRGSSRWLGDATGNRWIHISLVDPA